MANRFHVLSWVAALLCFLVAGWAHAEVPNLVFAAKLLAYTQTSEIESQPNGAGFGIQVSFPAPVNTALTVQVKAPSGRTVSLALDPTDYTWGYQEFFATRAELDSAYPDGNYTVLVTGGAANSTTVFTYATRADVAPARITNFAYLQNADTLRPTISWSPIPAATADDFMSVSVSTPDGKEIASSGGNPANTTSIAVEAQRASTALVGELEYAALSTTQANNSGTTIATGTGFVVDFPLWITLPLPVITFNPLAVAIRIGGAAQFTVMAKGEGLSYQWRHDGVAIPGAISSFVSVSPIQVSDAGYYTVDVSNDSGSVTSEPATLVVAPTFTASVFAGDPNRTGPSVDGTGTSARFKSPTGIAFDDAGNLYLADRDAAMIRKVTPAKVVTTLAGADQQTGSVDGTGADARFRTPFGIAVDHAGNVFVSDSLDQTIRRITPGGTVSTFAGKSLQKGWTDGTGDAARFNEPSGLAFDAAGNLFVADSSNNVIRKITPAGVVSTFVGGSGQLYGPRGLAFDPQGNLVVTDTLYYVIRVIAPDGVVIATYGSTSESNMSWSAGISTAVAFEYPNAVAVDRNGVIWVGTMSGLYRITADGFAVQVADQEANRIYGLAFDAGGTLYGTNDHVIYTAAISAGSSQPLITVVAPPQTATIASGGSVVFAATTTGLVQSYQWLRNGVPIPGATTAKLMLRGVNDPARYAVQLANVGGVITTTAGTLTLTDPVNDSRIVNLSIRSFAGQGSQTLIAGFGVRGGNGSTPSLPLVLRGVGPTLADFAVANVLTTPSITLYGAGSTVLGGNTR